VRFFSTGCALTLWEVLATIQVRSDANGDPCGELHRLPGGDEDGQRP
jgi:hypothetical protein